MSSALDHAWVEGIYEEITSMIVDLDPDPLIYGPKRLNNKVATARNMLSRLERISVQVQHQLHLAKRKLLLEETDFSLQKMHLLANDPTVMAGKNLADREAIASMKLSDSIKNINNLKSLEAELDSLDKVLKAKRSDLKDVQTRLRDQRNLCLDEISLGGRWGSRPYPAIQPLELGQGVATDEDIQAVERLLREGDPDDPFDPAPSRVNGHGGKGAVPVQKYSPHDF